MGSVQVGYANDKHYLKTKNRILGQLIAEVFPQNEFVSVEGLIKGGIIDLIYADIFLFNHRPDNIDDISLIRRAFLSGYSYGGSISETFMYKRYLYYVYLALIQIVVNLRIGNSEEVKYFLTTSKKIID